MAKKTFDDTATEDITNESINSHLMTLKNKEGVKIVAKPIDIFTIIPDITQPRRAIPFSVRASFKNTPDLIPVMLTQWKQKTENFLAFPIDEYDLITNGGEGSDINPDSLPGFVKDYYELISLAASIHREGLTNPITVSDVGDLKRIETGERRYLAHHLLTMHIDEDKYAKIAAQTVTRDVWRQASENGARKPLNAIGLARQLALLIMDMYTGDRDVFFDKFESLVLPGECDRKYYAQVANGNRYRIKRGMSQKILDVTGLKSRSQIQQYRNLLSLPDELWTESDENDYTEGRIRAILDEINGTNRLGQSSAENGYMSPIGDITQQSGREFSPVRSSILPGRTAPPSTNGASYHTDNHRNDDDIIYEPDNGDYEENPYMDNWQDSQPETRQSSPPPAQRRNDPLYDKRVLMAPIINNSLQLLKICNGQHIQIGDEVILFNADGIIKLLENYQNASLTEVIQMVEEFTTDYLEEELTEQITLLGDLNHALLGIIYGHCADIINTAIEYSQHNG